MIFPTLVNLVLIYKITNNLACLAYVMNMIQIGGWYGDTCPLGVAFPLSSVAFLAVLDKISIFNTL